MRGLADGWGVRAHAIEFLPVGAGGYHWAINDAWFVTVNVGTDVPALAHALDTAMVLRLPVVLAPADLRSPWTAGPYGEPARDLLRRHATRIRTWLAEFDTFAAAAGRTTNWAITHGEPHPGNILRTPAGPELIDGDTVRLAPPERDLWMLTSAMFGATPTRPPLAQPLRARHSRPVSPELIAFYRLWWLLADVATYATELRHPHTAGPDSTSSLRYLTANLQ